MEGYNHRGEWRRLPIASDFFYEPSSTCPRLLRRRKQSIFPSTSLPNSLCKEACQGGDGNGRTIRCGECYRGPTHRGGKSGCKLVTEFDSYSDDGVSAVIGVQHREVPELQFLC